MTDFAARYDSIILDPVMRRYYGASGYYNTGYWTPDTTSQVDASENLVERLLVRAPLAPSRILDVACGLGATTAAIARRFPAAEVIGINLSDRQLAVARERVSGCTFQRMDATRLDFHAGAFDLVVCVEAAFHFYTRRSFFAEAHRVLKSGGRLLLSDILFSTQRWAGGWTVPAANAVPDVMAYRQLLVEAGFTAIEVEDATEACWDAYCRSLGQWLRAEHDDGRLDEATWAGWSTLVRSLSRGTVDHYLVAVAAR